MLCITTGVAYGSILLYLTRSEYDITAISSGVNIAILVLASLSLILKYITNLSISNSYIPVGIKNATGINDPASSLLTWEPLTATTTPKSTTSGLPNLNLKTREE